MILEKGEEGILQSDLWKKLDATGREGSSIALKLEAKDIIRRERELAGGRWTYRLFINKKPLTLDSILDVPCFLCEDIHRCENGGKISPDKCDKLSQWLLTYGTASKKELEDSSQDEDH